MSRKGRRSSKESKHGDGKTAKKNKKDKSEEEEKKVTEKSDKKVKETTLQAVEAMSSSDEEGHAERNNKGWSDKADALKKMIQSGACDKVLKKNRDGQDSSDESIEEVFLGGDEANSSGSEGRKGAEGKPFDTALRRSVEKAKRIKKSRQDDPITSHRQSDSDSDSGEGSEDKSVEDEEENMDSEPDVLYEINSKALKSKTEELLAEKKDLPWVETFVVIPSTPLPFGQVDEESGLTIDVHDDLKREVAFYDIAMEAVETARAKCKDIGVPFTRPDDFFAEMVKSDDHMARVKDRLIFENKKIEAVAQRKSNREQKLRAKEAHSNKLADKSRRRKENIKAADDWAQSTAASNLKKMSGEKRGRDGDAEAAPNKKRMAANKKYGHRGKSPRFKQNTQADINDMSSFNPKGNVGGLGSKKKGGSGAKRKGKRARDAGRSRQRS